jgi:uncharacterized membrane protein
MAQTPSATATQTFGPGELIVIAFPQEQIPETVLSAVGDVLAEGVVTLLDMALVRRTSDDGVEIVDVASLPGPGAELDVTVTEVSAPGLVGDEDLAAIADTVEPGTSALVVLLEHTWARAVTAAIRDAGAVLIGAERFSAEVMNEVGALAAT